MGKSEIRTGAAPKAIGPYSQGVAVGRQLFLSGQIPIDPATGELTGASVAEQTRRVLENLKGVLEEAGASMGDVVKTTVYMKDLSAFAEMNAVYGEFFTAPYPARATVEVSALPKGAAVEIDAIVIKGE